MASLWNYKTTVPSSFLPGIPPSGGSRGGSSGARLFAGSATAAVALGPSGQLGVMDGVFGWIPWDSLPGFIGGKSIQCGAPKRDVNVGLYNPIVICVP